MDRGAQLEDKMHVWVRVKSQELTQPCNLAKDVIVLGLFLAAARSPERPEAMHVLIGRLFPAQIDARVALSVRFPLHLILDFLTGLIHAHS